MPGEIRTESYCIPDNYAREQREFLEERLKEQRVAQDNVQRAAATERALAGPVKDLSEGKAGEGKRISPGSKPRFDLLPPRVLFQISEVYQYGALKYRDRNWELGMPWGWHFAAAMRHAWKFWMGIENDACPTNAPRGCAPLPEWELSGCKTHSGLPHLAHAIWGLMALLEYTVTYRKGDDRSSTIVAQMREQNRKEGC